MPIPSHSESYKYNGVAIAVAEELRLNEALNIVVEPVRRDQATGRYRVVVIPGDGLDFEDFDNGYVLAFLTAWKIAAEGKTTEGYSEGHRHD